MAPNTSTQQPSTSLVPMVPLVARDFHCSEVSEPIPPSQRAEREAMKREAQRQRMEAAKITNSGRNCSVLEQEGRIRYNQFLVSEKKGGEDERKKGKKEKKGRKGFCMA